MIILTDAAIVPGAASCLDETQGTFGQILWAKSCVFFFLGFTIFFKNIAFGDVIKHETRVKMELFFKSFFFLRVDDDINYPRVQGVIWMYFFVRRP